MILLSHYRKENRLQELMNNCSNLIKKNKYNTELLSEVFLTQNGLKINLLLKKII